MNEFLHSQMYEGGIDDFSKLEILVKRLLLKIKKKPQKRDFKIILQFRRAWFCTLNLPRKKGDILP